MPLFKECRYVLTLELHIFVVSVFCNLLLFSCVFSNPYYYNSAGLFFIYQTEQTWTIKGNSDCTQTVKSFNQIVGWYRSYKVSEILHQWHTVSKSIRQTNNIRLKASHQDSLSITDGELDFQPEALTKKPKKSLDSFNQKRQQK